MPLSEIQLGMATLAGLGWHPRFGVLIGIGEHEDEVEAGRRTLVSLRRQAYSDWHAVIVRRSPAVSEQILWRLLDGFDDIAARIESRLDADMASPLVRFAEHRQWRRTPELIGVLLAGDVLSCDALLEMAITSGLQPDAEFFYSDELRRSPVSGEAEAFFKPQWSPDLLTATNYVGRFWCALAGVLSRTRATAAEWLAFGDYDLVLRCTEASSAIWHVPKLLCERGRDHLDQAVQERAALARLAQRRGFPPEVEDGACAGYYRLKRQVRTEAVVSIIIPSCAANGAIKRCIESLRELTAYREFEVICVENIADEDREWNDWVRANADQVATADGAFNWSRFANIGAALSTGEFLLFLHDDVEITEPQWLEALLEHSQRDEVGVVGARLLDPDRNTWHAGIVWTQGSGRHAFRHLAESEPGYFGLALSERNVIAVSGACLMTRRE
jgi:hypothetical protein